ncbi:MAG: M28 family peptidase, partial [Kangiellaceae bacterium]|nr:M28 family peptidase [Kangiellaceae bacterium]
MKKSLVAFSFFLCAGSLNLEAEPVKNLDIETDKEVWISIGQDATNLLDQRRPELVRIPETQRALLKQNKVAVVSIKESQLHVLSEFMHENFRRCGGYFHHNSYEQAISFVNKSAELKTKSVINYTIDNGEVVNSLLAKIVPSNMTSTVTSMGNYNNRFYTQQSGVDAANWLKEQWQSMSNSRADISVELYNHSNWSQPSVIATITGSTNSDEFVVIGGHLDSINGMGGATARAPGYDDNASGIAVITETLNAIVASDFRPARTLLLMGYAAEEVGLR